MSKKLWRHACCALGALAISTTVAALPSQAKMYRIALSNSYIGNEWRVEMINLMQAYVAQNLKDKVEFTVNNSGTDVQKQIAAISDMISEKVDAILINPVSETALNPIIAEATKQGIVVVGFDHRVSAPSAYKVGEDFVKFGEVHAQWMADTLNGKGNVIINRGVPGFEGDKDIYKGTRNVLDKYPDIHIIAEVYGKWDDAVSQAELTKALVAHPNVDGILNQAGEFGALQALLNLKHPMIAMTGEGTNGWRLAMLNYKDQGFKGLSAGDPPVVGAYALKVALDILEGHGPATKDVWVPIPRLTTAELKPGVNVFPDLPPTVYDDIDIEGSGIHLTVQDAMKAQ